MRGAKMSHTAAKEAGKKTIVKYEISFIFENSIRNRQQIKSLYKQLRTMDEFHNISKVCDLPVLSRIVASIMAILMLLNTYNGSITKIRITQY